MMGQPYQERFSKGALVKIAAKDALEHFRDTWQYHHKLEPVQLSHANGTARVASVGFYHGGDVLYKLEGVPGIWHECCLSDAGHVGNSN